VNRTAPLSPRLLAVIGAVAAAALALFVSSRVVFGGSDEQSSTQGAEAFTTKPAGTGQEASSAVKPKPKPKVVLLPGLPAPVARQLMTRKVVVVTLYTATATLDRSAVSQARSGAAKVGAGFAALNVIDERRARSLEGFVGTTSSPVVLVVRRPGKIVKRLDGYTDSEIVAQAAHNAGAGR